MTIGTLHARVSEHEGLSHGTGAPLVRPSQSSIRDNALIGSLDISNEDFKIVPKQRNEHSKRITDPFFIDLSSGNPLKFLPI